MLQFCPESWNTEKWKWRLNLYDCLNYFMYVIIKNCKNDRIFNFIYFVYTQIKASNWKLVSCRNAVWTHESCTCCISCILDHSNKSMKVKPCVRYWEAQYNLSQLYYGVGLNEPVFLELCGIFPRYFRWRYFSKHHVEFTGCLCWLKPTNTEVMFIIIKSSLRVLAPAKHQRWNRC